MATNVVSGVMDTDFRVRSDDEQSGSDDPYHDARTDIGLLLASDTGIGVFAPSTDVRELFRVCDVSCWTHTGANVYGSHVVRTDVTIDTDDAVGTVTHVVGEHDETIIGIDELNHEIDLDTASKVTLDVHFDIDTDTLR